MDFLTEYRKTVAAEIDVFIRNSCNRIADDCKSIAAHGSALKYSAERGDFNDALEHLDKIVDYFGDVKDIVTYCARHGYKGGAENSPLMKLFYELEQPPKESVIFKRGAAVFNAIKQEQPDKDGADNV